ncbi:Uncharacterized protein APZ42_008196 [Daphnia magna]|uniref:Uncharacterized protein n=1 Tax=Daphnia magna TaxID=35525 RepID=A0A164ET92_9CRUS|nr:Uncharacterized protein APZ42_008196 [Daphnia magna]
MRLHCLMDVVATSLLPNAKAVVCASMSVLHGLGMMKFKYEYENMLDHYLLMQQL